MTSALLSVVVNNAVTTVTSQPAGLECTALAGTDCQESYPRTTRVILTATPISGSLVWQGCDSVQDIRFCIVTMNADRTVTLQ